jgi:DNA gyrase/topoisomerase IV subunit A
MNPRRTVIEEDVNEMNMEDYIEEEDVVITMTHFGYCKRVPVASIKASGAAARDQRPQHPGRRFCGTDHDHLHP